MRILVLVLLSIFFLTVTDAAECLPKNFRASSTNYCYCWRPPTRDGLSNLRASGSGQFSEAELKALVKTLDRYSPVFIVDLREEPHGFLKGAPVVNPPAGALPESEVVRRAGARYFRLRVTDNMAPRREEVDRFVSFVNELPEGAWLHFHCAQGRGRTTTFLAMYDMMRNARVVAFTDIMARQHLLGGVNLLKLPGKGAKDRQTAKERMRFLRRFYDYSREHGDTFQVTWSDYVERVVNQAANS